MVESFEFKVKKLPWPVHITEKKWNNNTALTQITAFESFCLNDVKPQELFL